MDQNDPHIFVCPECMGLSYEAFFVEEIIEEKWHGEYQNILHIETCRHYKCTCNDCDNEWHDYECDHEYEGDA